MDSEQRQHLEELRNLSQQRLRVLERQAAVYGIDTPPHILIQIENLRKDIANLDVQLANPDILSLYNNGSNQKSQNNKRVETVGQESTPPRKLRVFLCHSSGDKPAVRNLYQRLHDEDFEPWLDEENLLPGQNWQREIPKAVHNSDVVIVCLSQKSTERTGYVQKEIEYALDAADRHAEDTIFIVPLRLEECDVPERLSRWHWVNLFEERGYDRLLRALKTRAKTLDIIATAEALLPEQLHEKSTKEIGFLTFDSRPLLKEEGKVWSYPYELPANVADLLNDVYFSLDNHVPTFTYEDFWILQDRGTGYIFIDIGTKWSLKHHGTKWDERSLSEVGIFPGMYLEITWPYRKPSLSSEKDTFD